jgi:sugar phosphate isomerase/epimerase
MALIGNCNPSGLPCAGFRGELAAMKISRRQFGAGLAMAGTATAFGLKPEKRLRLGLDNFAVRAMGWKADELIDYAVKLKCDSLFITDLYAFKNFNVAYLKKVKRHADDKGLKLFVGSWSICPTSTRFKDEWGTADEHLQLGIRVAKTLGSPAFRVILGSRADRLTKGGIDARIADTVKVLKRNKARAKDTGIKVAVENHAGDLHSLELVRLIEEAGRDWVGANLDSGNAVWTLEDPLENLKNLAPYAITTSLRDTMMWPSEHGFKGQWTAMGDGLVDWKMYFAHFAKVCPGAPVCLEPISGFVFEIKTKQEDYWKNWPKGKPRGYGKFVEFAKRGRPKAAWKAPEGVDRKKAQQAFQREDLERSVAYCQKLGLGRVR